jgi:hypothetical protein
MSAAISSSDQPDPTYLDRIIQDIPTLLPNHPNVVSILPITAPGGLHPNVQRIILSSGESVISKCHLFSRMTAGKPHHHLAVERATSERLIRNGCPVPAVLGAIEDLGVVILEDVGDETLDDYVQTRTPISRAGLATSAADAFVHIQETLIQQDDLEEGQIAPGCDEESVKRAFGSLTAAFDVDRLRSLIRQKDKVDNVLAQIHRLVTTLVKQPVYLGPTDYNARNIVVAKSGRPFYLEWSKLGYDWPERRVVQYLTSLGTGRADARPMSLIDPWIAEQYASTASWSDPETAAFSLDAHHLIFHILLALRWVERADRLPGSIKTALSTPLSPSPVTIGIRKQFTA